MTLEEDWGVGVGGGDATCAGGVEIAVDAQETAMGFIEFVIDADDERDTTGWYGD